jgi:hypothetical protein
MSPWKEQPMEFLERMDDLVPVGEEDDADHGRPHNDCADTRPEHGLAPRRTPWCKTKR